MGYTKKWVPPTIPLRDNLAAWKTLFLDLHDNLILAGLVQTATPGQLDISAVSALPADNSYEGFREYAFTDDLQEDHPVVIMLEFGCGTEGLAHGGQQAFGRTRTPRIRCSVFHSGGLVSTSFSPQGFVHPTSNNTRQLTDTGASTICYAPERGFFGIVYGAGSRNKPFVDTAGSYYGATLALFIQRPLDMFGEPAAGALAVYVPGLNVQQTVSNLWTTGVVSRAYSVYCVEGGAPVSRNDMAPRIGREGFSGTVDEAMLEPIHWPSNPPKPFPYIASYRHTDISDGVEFDFRDMYGVMRNFIALGRETSMSIDAIDGQRAGIAMLFE